MTREPLIRPELEPMRPYEPGLREDQVRERDRVAERREQPSAHREAPRRRAAARRGVLPGFGLSTGFTVLYLCVVVLVPLDEALARSVVDLSGRPYIVFESPVDKELLLVTREFPFALVEEFWKSAAFRGKLNLHVDVIRARNGHHAAEAVFKSAARALRIAASRTGSGIVSTKGTLTA